MNTARETNLELQLRIRPALAGMLFAVLTLLFGFGLGVIFGANEGAIKDRLKASALEVRTSVYHDDDVALKAALDKSWVYVQRAHLHAGGLGAAAVALILVAMLLGGPATLTRAVSLGLGAGGLGYSAFWLIAAFRLPGVGSSAAAKESLAWLALPSSGAFVAATFVLSLMIIAAMRRKLPVAPVKTVRTISAGEGALKER
jgi:hypothetical protein